MNQELCASCNQLFLRTEENFFCDKCTNFLQHALEVDLAESRRYCRSPTETSSPSSSITEIDSEEEHAQGTSNEEVVLVDQDYYSFISSCDNPISQGDILDGGKGNVDLDIDNGPVDLTTTIVRQRRQRDQSEPLIQPRKLRMPNLNLSMFDASTTHRPMDLTKQSPVKQCYQYTPVLQQSQNDFQLPAHDLFTLMCLQQQALLYNAQLQEWHQQMLQQGRFTEEQLSRPAYVDIQCPPEKPSQRFNEPVSASKYNISSKAVLQSENMSTVTFKSSSDHVLKEFRNNEFDPSLLCESLSQTGRMSSSRVRGICRELNLMSLKNLNRETDSTILLKRNINDICEDLCQTTLRNDQILDLDEQSSTLPKTPADVSSRMNTKDISSEIHESETSEVDANDMRALDSFASVTTVDARNTFVENTSHYPETRGKSRRNLEGSFDLSAVRPKKPRACKKVTRILPCIKLADVTTLYNKDVTTETEVISEDPEVEKRKSSQSKLKSDHKTAKKTGKRGSLKKVKASEAQTNETKVAKSCNPGIKLRFLRRKSKRYELRQHDTSKSPEMTGSYSILCNPTPDMRQPPKSSPSTIKSDTTSRSSNSRRTSCSLTGVTSLSTTAVLRNTYNGGRLSLFKDCSSDDDIFSST